MTINIKNMKKNTDIDTGLFFLIGIVGWIVKIIFLILLFPIRVLIYRNNPLNVKRVKIIK